MAEGLSLLSRDGDGVRIRPRHRGARKALYGLSTCPLPCCPGTGWAVQKGPVAGAEVIDASCGSEPLACVRTLRRRIRGACAQRVEDWAGPQRSLAHFPNASVSGEHVACRACRDSLALTAYLRVPSHSPVDGQ